MKLVLGLLLGIGMGVRGSSCAALPKGYYYPNSAGGYAYRSGQPQSDETYKYTLKPDFLQCDELVKLNEYCVKQINRYRSGELKFTGGKSDSALGNPKPLQEATLNAKCQAENNMGDLVLMGKASGNCGLGAHQNAWACQAMGGSQAQNACCPRNAGSTYASVAAVLDGCLTQMWDEGLNPSGVTGHWKNMKGPAYSFASCSFVFAKSSSGGNVVHINQNFASAFNSTKALESYTSSAGALLANPFSLLLLLLVMVL
ncbi:hypothetical protein BASA81_011257 [Batrachochytrium salamandrivorans]|nr:hypothetical protein BASA81_011257 [Batrachochytrium salamandrivorans]